MTTFSPPRALQRGDRVGVFDCGVASLDSWFRTLALRNQTSGGSRTFVTTTEDELIAGYYCLSSFAVAHDVIVGKGAGLPDPVPTTLIGRLAVDLRFQGFGLGRSLLLDAFTRAVQVSLQVGSAAIIIHASDESVVPFYERFGFTRLSPDSHTLYLPMTDAMNAIERLRNER